MEASALSALINHVGMIMGNHKPRIDIFELIKSLDVEDLQHIYQNLEQLKLELERLILEKS